MKRRSAIHHDPLDQLVSANGGEPQRRAVTPRPTVAADAKVRATFHIPERLLHEARNAVVALSGPPQRLTLADLAERALRAEIVRLQKAHNGGDPFPPAGKLRGGRPIGS